MSAGNLPAGISRLTLDGGLGNDTLLGSRGADFLLGGDGDDYVDGQQGDDVAFLGAGNDLFQWEPGDGSDVIEGQDGSDKLMFYGSNASENFDIYSIGERVRLFRDLAAVSMDMNDLEMVELRTLGGSDNVVVGDMTGTDLSNLELALRGPNGGGDTESDAITVNGTQGNDQFGVNGDSGGIRIIGLATTVDIYDHDNDLDRLTLNGQGGDDMIDARSLRENTITLTINGGLGADTIFGSDGSDTITGGDGNDVAFMGNGDDIFVWNPGDDNDIIEGQAGQDEMRFNGSNIAENIDISANGSRVRLFRNIANVLMDTNGVEAITFNALGGSDVVVINDLAGTDVTEVNLNLSASNGSGDLLPDSVIINGTNDDDVILASGSASGISVFGLWTTINVIGSEVTDNIIVNARAGDDVVDASGLTADAIQLTVDAGDGNDVAIGGDGSDVLLGGDGDDVLIGGPGLDLLDGGLGDNILIQ